SSHVFASALLPPPPPCPPLFPYTTLFRSLRIVRDEHASLAAMLRSLLTMLDRGPETDGAERFFDVLRAMLFYIGEFPEKLHHPRSEEHTSELQSRENLVCRLLLEKKKKQT